MTEEVRAVMLKVPRELDAEIESISKKRYRSKQEFILECVREKLDKLERQEVEA
jgi:Arc/MetJ-type ribon-helix-helix transcriptional regulator